MSAPNGNQLLVTQPNDTPAGTGNSNVSVVGVGASGQVATLQADGSIKWVAGSTGIPAGGAAGQVIGYGGSPATGAWVYPPGFEIAYAALTTDISVTSTTEATGTTVITSGAVTFDGAAVMMELFIPEVVVNPVAGGNNVIISLFESSTQIGRVGILQAEAALAQLVSALTMKLRFTPTAGSHTYTVTAFKTAGGSVDLIGDVGGTAKFVAGYLRFTKV